MFDRKPIAAGGLMAEVVCERVLDGYRLVVAGSDAGRLLWVSEPGERGGWWLYHEGYAEIQLYKVPLGLHGDLAYARQVSESACLGFAELIAGERGLESSRPHWLRVFRSTDRLVRAWQAQAIEISLRIVEWLGACFRRPRSGSEPPARTFVDQDHSDMQPRDSALSPEAWLLMDALLAALPEQTAGLLREEMDREVEAFGDRAVLLALARLLRQGKR